MSASAVVERTGGEREARHRLLLPGVAGYGAAVRWPVQVSAAVGVHAGAQPLAAVLVPGVQHVHDLVTVDAQRAAVRLAGDVEVDAYVEGVSGSQRALRQVPLEAAEGCGRIRTGERPRRFEALRAHVQEGAHSQS